MSKEKVLVLDFDGVICNSIDECLLTSYNTYFGEKYKSLTSIPKDNKDFFYKHRQYVRPAREFSLIHKAFADSISDFNLDKFNTMLSKETLLLDEFEKAFFQRENY